MRHLYWSVDRLPFCCGVLEIGEMEVCRHEDDDHEMYSWDDLGESDDAPLDRALDKILDGADGRPVLFNFVRSLRYDKKKGQLVLTRTFDADAFRRIVMAHPCCYNLGKTINPGTKNQIHMLMIKGYKK